MRRLVWTNTARFALTLDDSASCTQSHVVKFSNLDAGMPASIAATTRLRKSPE